MKQSSAKYNTWYLKLYDLFSGKQFYRFKSCTLSNGMKSFPNNTVFSYLLFQGIAEKQPFWLMLFSLFKYNFKKIKKSQIIHSHYLIAPLGNTATGNKEPCCLSPKCCVRHALCMQMQYVSGTHYVLDQEPISTPRCLRYKLLVRHTLCVSGKCNMCQGHIINTSLSVSVLCKPISLVLATEVNHLTGSLKTNTE